MKEKLGRKYSVCNKKMSHLHQNKKNAEIRLKFVSFLQKCKTKISLNLCTKLVHCLYTALCFQRKLNQDLTSSFF